MNQEAVPDYMKMFRETSPGGNPRGGCPSRGITSCWIGGGIPPPQPPTEEPNKGGTPLKEEGWESGQWEVEAEGVRGIGALSLTTGLYSFMWPEAGRA